MKRILFGSCVFALIALAVAGVWRAKATGPTDEDQTITVTPSTTNGSDLAIGDMVTDSQVIATGRCLGTRSEWIEDGRVLVTVATIAVDEVLKGQPGETLTVVLPGGIDANRQIPVAMTYPGAPQIAPEEEVFLFLNGDDSVAGGYSVYGFAEGKYSIVEDQAGDKVVARDFTKNRVQQSPGLVRGNRPLVPLSEFKGKVRSYLGQ
jgi:hypothetical protein